MWRVNHFKTSSPVLANWSCQNISWKFHEKRQELPNISWTFHEKKQRNLKFFQYPLGLFLTQPMDLKKETRVIPPFLKIKRNKPRLILSKKGVWHSFKTKKTSWETPGHMFLRTPFWWRIHPAPVGWFWNKKGIFGSSGCMSTLDGWSFYITIRGSPLSLHSHPWTVAILMRKWLPCLIVTIPSWHRNNKKPSLIWANGKKFHQLDEPLQPGWWMMLYQKLASSNLFL